MASAGAADADGEASSVLNRGQQSPLASQRSVQPDSGAKAQGQQAGARFPLGYKEGFSQWWAGLSPAVTEHRVLSFVPFLQRPPANSNSGSAPPSTSPSSSDLACDSSNGSTNVTSNAATDPYGPRRWASNLVKLAGKDRAINEFSVERVGEDVENNLVMLHGYGAGLAFWYKNYEALSRLSGWRLYSLDLLGMGRSSRPPFRIQAKDKAGRIAEAESWFVDALEDWRKQRGIERFTLMGHSLGGYMATAYALKYPGHLNKLILASPVGIPEDPYAVNDDLPEPTESEMVNEFTQDQDDTTRGSGKNGATPPPARPYPKWLVTLWDANISPFSIVRWAGPLGPRLVSGWTSRRFSHLPAEESQALHDYSYSLFRQRGSGEYALAYILAPGAFARSPLIRRFQGVGRQYIPPRGAQSPKRQRENGYPVVFLYGENDWMDVKGGYAAQQKMLDARKRILAAASREEETEDEGAAKVIVVPRAGHHVYLDGWEFFNKVVAEEMEEVAAREKSKSARG